jgi:hypothetical protein
MRSLKKELMVSDGHRKVLGVALELFDNMNLYL